MIGLETTTDLVITRVNFVLREMIKNETYKIVHYYLKNMLKMEKLVCKETDELHLNITERTLNIPAYILNIQQEAIEWMLLHEACHLDNGDDVHLRHLSELLDNSFNQVISCLHYAIEKNANIKTIDIFGGLPAEIIGDEKITNTLTKINPVDINMFYDLVGRIRNEIIVCLSSLREEQESIKTKQQQEP